jgi:hypothetical protein
MKHTINKIKIHVCLSDDKQIRPKNSKVEDEIEM